MVFRVFKVSSLSIRSSLFCPTIRCAFIVPMSIEESQLYWEHTEYVSLHRCHLGKEQPNKEGMCILKTISYPTVAKVRKLYRSPHNYMQQ